MIDQVEMMKAIEKLRGDAVVVPVFRANVAWSKVTNNAKRDILNPHFMVIGNPARDWLSYLG